MSVTVGIDPGLTGAIAVYDLETRQLHALYDMPIATIGTKRNINAVELHNLLRISRFVKRVIVEHVAAMPKQGVSSSFNFGVGYGIVLGVLASYRYPITKVAPSKWKAEMGIKPGSDKDGSRLVATHEFGHNDFWPLKKHHGRAEAALLAKYGARLV